MSMVRLVDLVILVGLLWILLRMVPAAWHTIRVYAGIRDRRLADGSSFAPPPSAAVSAIIDRLAPSGFSRIGERTLVLPGNQRRFEWDLVDTASTTYVALAPAPYRPEGVLLICYSAFDDGAFVQTAWPASQTVRRPDLLATSVATSPEATVAAHRLAVAEFEKTHGPALPNRSMADLLERDATYRTRHGGATLRTRTYRFVGITALLVFAAGAQLVRLLALDH